MHRYNFFLIMLFFALTLLQPHDIRSQSQGSRNSDEASNPVYCVLFHSPGPKWEQGVPFNEQQGVMEHVKYMSRQLEDGMLLIGGPFLDNSGGMMICTTSDLEKAKAMAEADPTVKSGLLTVQVKKWMVPMSSLKLPDNEKN